MSDKFTPAPGQSPAAPEEIEAMLHAVEERRQTRAPKPDPAPPPALLGEAVVTQCERENYLGDGKIYRHFHRGKVVYVHTWEKWLVWMGHHWAVDINSRRALSLVEEVAQEYLRVAGIYNRLADPEQNPELEAKDRSRFEKLRDALNARAKRCRGTTRAKVLEYVHTGGEESLAIDGAELDANPWLLACANGVIDLETQEFRAGRLDDYITLASPTEWRGPAADATPFLRFLREILGDDDQLVEFMLRFLGMALFGRQREHKFLVLFGEGGRNGKDTLMGILRDVLGKDLCSDVAPEMFMEQSFVRDSSKAAPDLMRLRGKRVIYASESSKRHRFSSETVKRLTGGNSLSARNLNEGNMTEWEMSHTIILLTNALPAAPPDDDAFWTRLLGIELTRRFVDDPDPSKPEERPKNPDLRDEMRACSPGILALLVKGFGDYLASGLQPPPQVKAFSENYRKDEDVVGRFLADCCELHEESKDAPDHRTQASELRECFNWWFTQEVANRVPNPKFLSSAMAKKGIENRKISSNFYLGVTITPDARREWDEWKREQQEKRQGKSGNKRDQEDFFS